MTTLSLITDRLILRPQTIDDFAVWYPMYADPTIFHLSGTPGFTAEEAWNRLLRNVGHWAAFGYGIFAVFQKSDGRFLGETGLANFHRGIGADFDPHAEASWVISPDAQHKGVAKEAASAAHRWFAQTYHPTQTVCLIAKNNLASIRVAEHVGYQVYDRCGYKGAECLKLVCSYSESSRLPESGNLM